MNNDPTYQQPLCSPCATCDESNTTTTRKQDDNETKTTSNGTVKCVPQKRFPEFQNEREWETVSFADLFSLLSNNTLSRAELSTEGEGIYNIHYGDILIKYPSYVDIQKTTLPCIKEANKISNIANVQLQDGDIVIADTAEDEIAGKCIEIGNVNDKVVVAGLHTIPCRPNKRFAPAYLGYYMNSHCFHSKLLPIMQGAKVTSISRSALKKVTITYPSSLEEQQMIASCLLSIDEDISAAIQKLEQLKMHKKALLQKLFPQRGKTTPELRFPEFQNAAEWRFIALGNVAKVKSGYTFKSTDYKKSGRYKIITIRNVQNGYLDMSDSNIIDILPDDIQSYQILKEGDILVSMTGNVGRVCKVNQSNCLLNQRVGIISIFNNDLDKDFIYSLLTDSRFQQSMIESGQGAAQANISNKDIESYTFAYPESKVEQRKITACLQAIENEIVKTISKVGVLQTQKEALMQQLFVK